MSKILLSDDLKLVRWIQKQGHCEFRRFQPMSKWRFGVATGRKRKRVRCPQCKRRLTLRTVVDHWPGHGMLGYEIPEHKAR